MPKTNEEEFVVDFADVSSGGLFKDMTPDNAAKVMAWIKPKRLKGNKGFYYEVNGCPVISQLHAKQLKATCKAKGWCEPTSKLSSYAWSGNKQDYKVDAWLELQEILGIDDDEMPEEDQVDV